MTKPISRRQEKKLKSQRTTEARAAQLSRIAEAQGDLCFFCNEKMGYDCTREHLLAKARCGTDAAENLRAAHGDCNSAAGHLPVEKKLQLREIGHKEGRAAMIAAAHRMRREDSRRAFRMVGSRMVVFKRSDFGKDQPAAYWKKLGLPGKPSWWDG